jgi:hypothetical protein
MLKFPLTHWQLPIITEDQKLQIHHCENLTISGYFRKEKGMKGQKIAAKSLAPVKEKLLMKCNDNKQ